MDRAWDRKPLLWPPHFTATPHLLHFSFGSGTIHNTPASMPLLSGPLHELFPLVEMPFFLLFLEDACSSLSEDFKAQKPPLWGGLCYLPPCP